MTFWQQGFTPKDTEEIKPGLFLKQIKPGRYKVVEPIFWDGKWRLRNQFSWRNILFIVLVLFIAGSYYLDTKACRNFQDEICTNIVSINSMCFEFEKLGYEDPKNFEDWEIENDKREDTNIG